MSRFMAGGTILLFLILTEAVGGYIQSQTLSSDSLPGCEDSNFTECENVGRNSFFDTVRSVSVQGFTDAPAEVNFFWLLITGTLLVLAVFLIVLSFFPGTSS